jgi:hypothetical protein
MNNVSKKFLLVSKQMLLHLIINQERTYNCTSIELYQIKLYVDNLKLTFSSQKKIILYLTIHVPHKYNTKFNRNFIE